MIEKTQYLFFFPFFFSLSFCNVELPPSYDFEKPATCLIQNPLTSMLGQHISSGFKISLVELPVLVFSVLENWFFCLLSLLEMCWIIMCWVL